MLFSDRSAFGDGVSSFGLALEAARARSGLLDLTISNPTRCGFQYSAEALLSPLADPTALHYAADPLGSLSAREAVSQLYRDAYGAEISPERILLTASTSESYGYLLRLLCNPGDAILVPSPSYPLFDLLTRLHDVELVPYPLVYHDGWQIDPASLDAAVTPRTRAIVVIHPNNPTGHFCSAADRATLYETAERHGLPLIVDEVFLDYPLEEESGVSFAAESASRVLTFTMGGLSKLLALPQMKVAWTAVTGPTELQEEAMERLEVIADTFLSVATPQQVALPVWLQARHTIQTEIKDRLNANLATLDAAIEGTVVSRLRVDAGWAAVLRVPATERDEALAVRLIEETGVVAHPGSLFGFPERGWLVVSLLVPTGIFSDGIGRIVTACMNQTS
jgi:aspartate/methionine/tyrosine aminotransferase